jgi:hypothetical protein
MNATEFASFRQGKTFHERQKNIKTNPKYLSLGKDTGHIVPSSKNANLKNIKKEGFTTSTNAVQQTNTLLNKSNNLLQQSMSEISNLQKQFNDVLNNYEASQSSVMTKTNSYIEKNQNGGSGGTSFLGKNVYVNSVVKDPSAKYVGCYADNNSRAMTSVANYGSQTYSFQTCMNAALDAGSSLFGLQDGTDGNAQCFLSNDLKTTQKYGVAVNQNLVALWSSGTAGSGNTAQLTTMGQLVVKSAAGNVLYSSPNAPADCVNGGGVSNIQATYGGNCHAPIGNVTDKVNSIIQGGSNMIPISNGTFGDPAEGCGKSFDISYQCGNAPITKHIDYAEGQTYNVNCQTQINACQFFLTLQPDGNMCIYRGTPSAPLSGAVWCTMTNGKQQDSNPNWVATKGKYGVSYILSSQALGSGEFIGSNDGKLQLIMQTDGNLVLYASTVTSGCKKGGDGKMYGGGWVNAVYQLSDVGSSSVVGQMGYVNDKNQLSVYPSSMLDYSASNKYNKFSGYDSVGNDLGAVASSSADSCKTACNGTANCSGFVFDNSTGTCYPKKNVGTKTPNTKTDYYLREPGVKNAPSCSKDVTNIDSVQWSAFKNTNQAMTPTTLCGLSNEVQREQNELNRLRAQLALLAQKIVEKIIALESMNVNLNDQIGIDKQVLDENLLKYKMLARKYANYNKNEVANIHGIVADSNTVVLQENYTYILWSVIAIGVVIVTINMLRPRGTQ